MVEQLRKIGRALIFPVIAVVLAFVVGALVILATGNNVLAAYGALLSGGFGSMQSLGRTIVNATPLIFTGLAVAVPFRAGLFNIGGEGQLFIGAITGVAVGLLMPGPGPLVIVTALVAAAVAGLLWGGIPGILKIFGAHEVITTIMLNFIAINLAYWLARNPLVGEGLVPGTDFVPDAVRIPRLAQGLGTAHYGFFIGIVAAIAAYLLIWRTTKGYELRAVGLAPGTARYAGMSIAANSVLAIALGGMFAAIGGGLEALGTFGKVSVPFVSNLGFNGIGVALLGRNHPAGVVAGALFFGGLASGAQQMQFATGVPLDLSDVLLAIVLLFVTATKLVELVIGRRARALAAGTKLEGGLAG
jgi:general nucleoside transport system permease protein